MNIKFKIFCFALLVVFTTLSCIDNDCLKYENYGDITLIPTSIQLFENIRNSTTAYFKDTIGNEYEFHINRLDTFYTSYQRCDSNEDGIVSDDDPVEVEYRMQKIDIIYYNESVTTLKLTLKVWIYAAFWAKSKEHLLNNVADELFITTYAPFPLRATLVWFVDNRNREEEISQSKQIRYADSLDIGNKIFDQVYWDEEILNLQNVHITYFNKQFGIVGIQRDDTGLLLYLDRVE